MLTCSSIYFTNNFKIAWQNGIKGIDNLKFSYVIINENTSVFNDNTLINVRYVRFNVDEFQALIFVYFYFGKLTW